MKKISKILPKHRNYVIIFFIPIWLYGFVHGNMNSNLTGLIMINVFFLIPALFLTYSVLYNIFGKEIIELHDEKFKVILKLFFYKKIKNYKLNQIDKFEFHDQEKVNYFKRSTLNYWGIGNGNIRFQYQKEYKYFGIKLYEFEAKPIIDQLNEKLKI